MKKLTKLRFRNFQRLKDLTIEVSPLVTVLVGATDAGKSSSIRGTSFALVNKPSSVKLVRRKQTKPAVVKAYFGKTVVKRVRGKKTNEYSLNGKVYKAFGRDKVPLPPDVQKFLNLSDVNFQRQIDGPSWFTDTAGNVSKRLNAIVDLAVVDSALTESARVLRDAAAKVKFSRERLRESKKLAAKLDWVPNVVASFKRFQRAESEYHAIRSRNAQVEKLLGEATSCRRIRDRALEAKLGAEKALRAGRELLKIRKRNASMGKLVRQLEQFEKVVSVELPDISPLVELRAKCDAVAEKRRGVEHLVNEALQTRKEKCRLEKQLAELARRERRLRPKLCKTCRQPLPTKSP